MIDDGAAGTVVVVVEVVVVVDVVDVVVEVVVVDGASEEVVGVKDKRVVVVEKFGLLEVGATELLTTVGAVVTGGIIFATCSVAVEAMYVFGQELLDFHKSCRDETFVQIGRTPFNARREARVVPLGHIPVLAYFKVFVPVMQITALDLVFHATLVSPLPQPSDFVRPNTASDRLTQNFVVVVAPWAALLNAALKTPRMRQKQKLQKAPRAMEGSREEKCFWLAGSMVEPYR